MRATAAMPAWDAHRSRAVATTRVVVILGQNTGGQSISLEVSPYSSLHSVKERVVEATGLPADQQLLLVQVVPTICGAAYGSAHVKRELLSLPKELASQADELQRLREENKALQARNERLAAQNIDLLEKAAHFEAARQEYARAIARPFDRTGPLAGVVVRGAPPTRRPQLAAASEGPSAAAAAVAARKASKKAKEGAVLSETMQELARVGSTRAVGGGLQLASHVVVMQRELLAAQRLQKAVRARIARRIADDKEAAKAESATRRAQTVGEEDGTGADVANEKKGFGSATASSRKHSKTKRQHSQTPAKAGAPKRASSPRARSPRAGSPRHNSPRHQRPTELAHAPAPTEEAEEAEKAEESEDARGVAPPTQASAALVTSHIKPSTSIELAGQEVHQLQSKFEMSGKNFQFGFSGLETYFGGLERYIGTPQPDILNAMEREHESEVSACLPRAWPSPPCL